MALGHFRVTILRVDPLSVEVKVIAVSKRNLSKTRLRVHFRQFTPINNLTSSFSLSYEVVYNDL